MKRKYNSEYKGENLNHIAFPVGGIGAGMFTLQGPGSLGNFSLRNKPEISNEPNLFAALHLKGSGVTKVLEGQVPKHKIFRATGAGGGDSSGNGLPGRNYGLPRFSDCSFKAAFPFAEICLQDDDVPLNISTEGFSPFIPCDSFNSSLPFGSLRYTFSNNSDMEQECVFYFNSVNFVKTNDKSNSQINQIKNGFEFYQPETDNPGERLWFNVFTNEPANIDTAWFRGRWFDAVTMLWNDMSAGVSNNRRHEDNTSGCGATLSIPFKIKQNQSKTICLFITWYAPDSNIREGGGDCLCEGGCGKEERPKYSPWYSGQFASVNELNEYVQKNYGRLYKESKDFSDCLFGSDLPPEVLEAVSANLSILKSPTILRQKDGRIWGWEGCYDNAGCCGGSCTHVWNYAQALCNLFPDLERGMRQTEFFDSQSEEGHQQFRAALPIGGTEHNFHAASDGQLGCIIKAYREWRISGDKDWLKGIWGNVKQSLNYCISTWDKKEEGILKECHHNTYDIEFYGADIMCTSFYLGALLAAAKIAEELSDDEGKKYYSLYLKGRKFAEEKLFNGEYFVQETGCPDLEVMPKPESDYPEDTEYFKKYGPKYQYGTGCISDGVIGAWLSGLSGLGDIIDIKKIKSHLKSVYKYNFKKNLRKHANPQRPGYASGNEGGLLLCSWPRGGKPPLPFVYSDEVWTGIEYEVASYLISTGFVKEGLDIVKKCRSRYSGAVRNPFNEYECGHWYARAMSSYALLQAFSGAFYDAVSKTLYLKPQIKGDFKCFISTASGYGYAGIKNGAPFIKVKKGNINVEKFDLVK